MFEAREERINQVLDRWTLMTPRSEVLITASPLHADAPLVGAAELAFTPLLANPAGVRPREVLAEASQTVG